MLKVGAWISIKTLLIFVFKALKSEFEKKTDVSESILVLRLVQCEGAIRPAEQRNLSSEYLID